ncbi:hypothetical protein M0805_005094 [Coniferiporia weirii]|nr:hypothetical protein M0805_005094 [Coniferiporia weirii]
MAFFASKSFDRDRSTLRRTFSTDRIRREGSSRVPTPATEFGVLADTNRRHGKTARPVADADAESSFPATLPVASSSTLASASSASASASAPFYVPHIPAGSASGSPASSVRMQAQTYASDSKYSLRAPSPASGAGSSKRSSPSPNPSRRRGQQQREGVPSSRDGSDTGHSSPSHSGAPSPAPGVSPSPSISSRRVDAVAMSASMARARSSPDLKVEQRTTAKSRSKTSLRAQIAENYHYNDSQGASGMLSTPVRQPKGPRSPHSGSSTPLSATAHANRNAARGMVFPSSSVGPSQVQSPASPSMSSSSSSPLSPPSSTRQRPATSSASTSTARREDPTLTIPKGYLSSGGSASDGSYGSPFCELGMGFNVKRLLSKPAASPGTSAVRSEPDTDGSYSYGYGYGGYSHSLNSSAAARRRRMDTSPRPPSARSTSAAGADASPNVQRMLYPGTGAPRKPTTSDPEPPQRQRGLERGYEKEGERERGRSGRAHVRTHSSSFSLSSPSEGPGAGYPFGLAVERERERAGGTASGGTQAHIQLTTSAVRRLSALGAREADSPVTPMSFSTSSPASASADPNSVVGTRVTRTAQHQQQQQSQSQQALSSRSRAPAGVSRRADSPPPPGLTPAEIVAHAYKQQERRRAELERDASKDVSEPDRTRIVQREKEKVQRTVRGKEKLTRSMSVEAVAEVKGGSGGGGGSSNGAEAPAPYYTVFGNPSGRIVAIGSARDSAFGLFERGGGEKKTEQAVVAEISMSSAPLVEDERHAAPLTLRRKLSRKMSGKFRRDGSMARGGKESSEGREGTGVGEWGDLFAVADAVPAEVRVNRPSLSLKTSSSERRSATLPRERTAAVQLLHRPSPKMSMDSFVAVQSTDSGSGRTLPSAVNGCIVSPITFIPGTWAREERDRIVSDPTVRPRVKGERHERENHKESHKDKDKGKLWGLVKRISSNALKDKYKPSTAEAPPPVPALPRDYSPVLPMKFDFEKTRESESSSAQEAHDTPVAVPKVTTLPLPTVTYGRRPSTAPALTPENSAGRFTVRQKQPSTPVQLLGVKSQSQGQEQRPSTTTRSSSPISSDMASWNSFNRSQSNRSSTSSYGEVTTNGKVVNISTTLGQHIVPPEKLFLFDSLDLSFGSLDDYGAKNRSDAGFGGLLFGEESSGHQALPVPPRRANQGRQEESRSRSPSIPTFSADNAVNTFGFRGRSAANTNSVTSAFTGTDFGGKESPSSNSPSPLSALDPPPRPPRSARRGPIPTNPSPPSISSVSRTISSERAGRESIGAHSQASTARPSVTRYSPSPSPSPPPLLSSQQSPVSATDSQTSTLTFHDAARPKANWTEKEKLDKWNDLLDRSEKAGGTLHVGLGGLLSDHMRESAYGGVRDSAYSEF